MERRASDLARLAFGAGVAVNRFDGSHVILHVGDSPITPFADHPPVEELETLNALPLVGQQGDGVRSFMSLALWLLAGDYPLVTIDEPEAFLHPPQATLLGRVIVEHSSAASQVFVATHSSDVLRGIVDAGSRPVTIIRLRRRGGINHATVLEPEEVRRLWDEPLLRYSHLLDGLFVEGVVVCEADPDCRFYESLLDEVIGSGTVVRRPDLLFTHVGGKARLASAVQAMRTMGVPVAAIADFDVLNDSTVLKRIVIALGGEWLAVADEVGKVQKAVAELGSAPLLSVVREKTAAAFGKVNGARLTPEASEEVRSATKVDSGWDVTKQHGTAGFTSAQYVKTAESLIAALRQMGLFIVPVGELERWLPKVDGHGPKWVSEVHRQELHKDVLATSNARDFVAAVAAFVSTVSVPDSTTG